MFHQFRRIALEPIRDRKKARRIDVDGARNLLAAAPACGANVAEASAAILLANARGAFSVAPQLTRYPWVVAPVRLTRELGFKYRYSSLDTLRAIVRAYR